MQGSQSSQAAARRRLPFWIPTPGQEEEVARARWGLALPEPVTATPPTPRPLPSTIPRRTRPDPANPLRLAIVDKWISRFHIRGRLGLQEAWYEYAQSELDELDEKDKDERANARASWGYLLKDRDDGTRNVVKVLQAIPDFILEALLRGDLPSRCRQDVEVRSYVRTLMRPTQIPSIYINLLRDFDGSWLCGNDILRLLDVMDTYLRVEPDKMRRPDQIEVDEMLSAWVPNAERDANDNLKYSQLRWRQNDRSESIIRQWMAHTRTMYCDNTVDATQPFPNGPSEIGWATNAVDSLTSHRVNRSTTYVYALVHAIERDESLCRVGEIVGSLLCSSYWFLGGFNNYYPGGMTWNEEVGVDTSKLIPPRSTEHGWGSSAQEMHRRLAYTKPIAGDADKCRRSQYLLRSAGKLPEMTEKLARVQDQVKGKKVELDNLNQEIKDLGLSAAKWKEEVDVMIAGRRENQTQEQNEKEEKRNNFLEAHARVKIAKSRRDVILKQHMEQLKRKSQA